jgi:hypothetical protein
MSAANDAMHAFLAEIDEARRVLAQISEVVDDHLEFDPDHINWGHVGTASVLVGRLREARAIVFPAVEG